MTRGQENTSGRLFGSDNVRDGRGREDSVLADDEFRDSVTGRELDDGLDDLGRVVAAIASNNEGRTLSASRDRGQDRLDEVLSVVLLLEHGRAGGKDRDECWSEEEREWGARLHASPLSESRRSRPAQFVAQERVMSTSMNAGRARARGSESSEGPSMTGSRV